MRVFFSALAVFVFFGMVVGSCKYDKDDVCVTNKITYTSHIRPLIDVKCSYSGCHNSGGFYDYYSNYEGLKTRVDNGIFRNRVLVLNDMPPQGHPQLTECELEQIEAWINAGAPVN